MYRHSKQRFEVGLMCKTCRSVELTLLDLNPFPSNNEITHLKSHLNPSQSQQWKHRNNVWKHDVVLVLMNQWRRSSIFVNFEQISRIALQCPLLTLSKEKPVGLFQHISHYSPLLSCYRALKGIKIVGTLPRNGLTHFLYPLKTSENQRFSDVFRRYWKDRGIKCLAKFKSWLITSYFILFTGKFSLNYDI